MNKKCTMAVDFFFSKHCFCFLPTLNSASPQPASSYHPFLFPSFFSFCPYSIPFPVPLFICIYVLFSNLAPESLLIIFSPSPSPSLTICSHSLCFATHLPSVLFFLSLLTPSFLLLLACNPWLQSCSLLV